METSNGFNSQVPMGSDPAPVSSKLGLIGLALGILGLIVFCGPMSVAFIAGATGTTADLGESGLLAVSLISYCGVFIGLIGAVLGGISLARGENKTYGIIAIVLGVLLLCTCSVLFAIGLGVSL